MPVHNHRSSPSDHNISYLKGLAVPPEILQQHYAAGKSESKGSSANPDIADNYHSVENVSQSQTSQSDSKYLSLEFRGSVYNWFDLSTTDAVHHSDFGDILAENILTYFGVPIENQILMSETGTVITPGNLRQTILTNPALRLIDVREEAVDDVYGTEHTSEYDGVSSAIPSHPAISRNTTNNIHANSQSNPNGPIPMASQQNSMTSSSSLNFNIKPIQFSTPNTNNSVNGTSNQTQNQNPFASGMMNQQGESQSVGILSPMINQSLLNFPKFQFSRGIKNYSQSSQQQAVSSSSSSSSSSSANHIVNSQNIIDQNLKSHGALNTNSLSQQQYNMISDPDNENIQNVEDQFLATVSSKSNSKESTSLRPDIDINTPIPNTSNSVIQQSQQSQNSTNITRGLFPLSTGLKNPRPRLQLSPMRFPSFGSSSTNLSQNQNQNLQVRHHGDLIASITHSNSSSKGNKQNQNQSQNNNVVKSQSQSKSSQSVSKTASNSNNSNIVQNIANGSIPFAFYSDEQEPNQQGVINEIQDPDSDPSKNDNGDNNIEENQIPSSSSSLVVNPNFKNQNNNSTDKDLNSALLLAHRLTQLRSRERELISQELITLPSTETGINVRNELTEVRQDIERCEKEAANIVGSGSVSEDQQQDIEEIFGPSDPNSAPGLPQSGSNSNSINVFTNYINNNQQTQLFGGITNSAGLNSASPFLPATQGSQGNLQTQIQMMENQIQNLSTNVLTSQQNKPESQSQQNLQNSQVQLNSTLQPLQQYPQADPSIPPTSSEIKVTLKRQRPDDRLGIINIPIGSEKLLIKSIDDNGLLSKYNQSCSSTSYTATSSQYPIVEEGDTILSVNNISKNVFGMRRELQSAPTVELVIQKTGFTSNIAATMSRLPEENLGVISPQMVDMSNASPKSLLNRIQQLESQLKSIQSNTGNMNTTNMNSTTQPSFQGFGQLKLTGITLPKSNQLFTTSNRKFGRAGSWSTTKFSNMNTTSSQGQQGSGNIGTSFSLNAKVVSNSLNKSRSPLRSTISPPALARPPPMTVQQSQNSDNLYYFNFPANSAKLNNMIEVNPQNIDLMKTQIDSSNNICSLQGTTSPSNSLRSPRATTGTTLKSAIEMSLLQRELKENNDLLRQQTKMLQGFQLETQRLLQKAFNSNNIDGTGNSQQRHLSPVGKLIAPQIPVLLQAQQQQQQLGPPGPSNRSRSLSPASPKALEEKMKGLRNEGVINFQKNTGVPITNSMTDSDNVQSFQQQLPSKQNQKSQTSSKSSTQQRQRSNSPSRSPSRRSKTGSVSDQDLQKYQQIKKEMYNQSQAQAQVNNLNSDGSANSRNPSQTGTTIFDSKQLQQQQYYGSAESGLSSLQMQQNQNQIQDQSQSQKMTTVSVSRITYEAGKYQQQLNLNQNLQIETQKVLNSQQKILSSEENQQRWSAGMNEPIVDEEDRFEEPDPLPKSIIRQQKTNTQTTMSLASKSLTIESIEGTSSADTQSVLKRASFGPEIARGSSQINRDSNTEAGSQSQNLNNQNQNQNQQVQEARESLVPISKGITEKDSKEPGPANEGGPNSDLEGQGGAPKVVKKKVIKKVVRKKKTGVKTGDTDNTQQNQPTIDGNAPDREPSEVNDQGPTSSNQLSKASTVISTESSARKSKKSVVKKERISDVNDDNIKSSTSDKDSITQVVSNDQNNNEQKQEIPTINVIDQNAAADKVPIDSDHQHHHHHHHGEANDDNNDDAQSHHHHHHHHDKVNSDEQAEQARNSNSNPTTLYYPCTDPSDPTDVMMSEICSQLEPTELSISNSNQLQQTNKTISIRRAKSNVYRIGDLKKIYCTVNETGDDLLVRVGSQHLPFVDFMRHLNLAKQIARQQESRVSKFQIDLDRQIQELMQYESDSST